MNFRQMISWGLLFLGLLFSSIIRVRFNISHGFEFHEVWVTWIPAIIDFALLSSRDHALTSAFLGYLFFVSAGFLTLNDLKAIGHKNKRLTMFLVLSIFALGFELLSIALDIFNSYHGQHLYMGLILFLLGMTILYEVFRSSKIIGAPHDD